MNCHNVNPGQAMQEKCHENISAGQLDDRLIESKCYKSRLEATRLLTKASKFCKMSVLHIITVTYLRQQLFALATLDLFSRDQLRYFEQKARYMFLLPGTNIQPKSSASLPCCSLPPLRLVLDYCSHVCRYHSVIQALR